MTYTAGELAKKLGVSARTIRFYDEKNLLFPYEYSEKGYRLYNDESAKKLQKIIMLKFLDFSLEQIREIMEEKSFDVRESLKEQENLLLQKREHIERILEAVKKARNAEDYNLWECMTRIIAITKEREDIILQYQNDDNFKKRIAIHDCSTSKIGFYPWMLENLEIRCNMKIMDLGCGNGAFWKNVAKKLPSGLEIHLLDYSEGMLESARNVVNEIQRLYPEKKLKFILEKRDATNFSYPIAGFDRIMANHLLFYLNKENRLELYREIQELLAETGRFSCSLIGKKHFWELHEFIRKYYPEIKIPSDSFDIWLETAQEELSDFFHILFVKEQKNDLMVQEEELIFNYILSYSKQAREIIYDDREQFMEYIRKEKNAEGYFYIHKSTGMISANKK